MLACTTVGAGSSVVCRVGASRMRRAGASRMRSRRPRIAGWLRSRSRRSVPVTRMSGVGKEDTMSRRAQELAARIEQGAAGLAEFAEGLSEAQWRTSVPGDGRMVGVTVHHVASAYPIEIQFAQTLARGEPIRGVTWSAVADMNAKHARDHATTGKQETLELLRRNAKAAAQAVRALTDEELDRAAPVSLNSDAPLTAQFMIEDHALRHSFHHL